MGRFGGGGRVGEGHESEEDGEDASGRVGDVAGEFEMKDRDRGAFSFT